MHMPPRPPETGASQPRHETEPVWTGEDQQGWVGQDNPQQMFSGIEGAEPEMDEAEPPQKRSLAFRLMVAAVALLAVLIVLRFVVFTVRNVHFVGLNAMTQQQAIQLSGLNHGLFYFTLQEEEVKNSVNKNRYLEYQGMEKIFPNALAVRVLERYPFAFFTHLGVGYVLAQDGIILEQVRDLRLGDGLIHINGLAVWGQQSPGVLPASTDPSQTAGMTALFEELLVWGFENQIKSIDISQSLNIAMQTDDGYTINLGEEEQLHAKIGTVFSVVNALRQRQMTGGIIEATLPGEATYRAEQ